MHFYLTSLVQNNAQPHTNDVHLSAGESCVVGFCFQCSQAEVTQLTHSECCGLLSPLPFPWDVFPCQGHPNFCHGLKICETICKSATNRLKLFHPSSDHFFREEAALTALKGLGSLWSLTDWCLLLQEGFSFSTPSPNAAKILIFGAVSQSGSSHSVAPSLLRQWDIASPCSSRGMAQPGIGSGWAVRHFQHQNLCRGV